MRQYLFARVDIADPQSPTGHCPRDNYGGKVVWRFTQWRNLLYWSDREVILLLEAVRLKESLWNTKSVVYRNQNLKLRGAARGRFHISRPLPSTHVSFSFLLFFY